jgi:membrane protease YdiL (CAAX protease family)
MARRVKNDKAEGILEIAINLALWWGPTLVLLYACRALGLCRVSPGALALSIIAYAIYVTAIMMGGNYIPLEAVFGELDWNWGGKIAAIGSTVLVFAVLALTLKGVSAPTAGFTFRQRKGSLLPAVIVTTLLAASVIGLEIAAADGTALDPERLAFQATMPGIDEELFFRGVLLCLLGIAAPSGGLNLLGARITVGGFLATVLFGLGHGLAYSNDGLQFSWIFVAITAYLGFGLLWLRERTGSVLWPIFAHNVINFSGSFF